MRWWERIPLILFGLTLAQIDAGPGWTTIVLGVLGWAIALAAVGLADVAMAFCCRARRSPRPG